METSTSLPFGGPREFSIAMGVRKGEQSLRVELDRILVSQRQRIRTILESYAVPLLDEAVD